MKHDQMHIILVARNADVIQFDHVHHALPTAGGTKRPPASGGCPPDKSPPASDGRPPDYPIVTLKTDHVHHALRYSSCDIAPQTIPKALTKTPV
jgi:hypothetical protein